ncbi:MAG: hypothetical protein WBF47_07515, partial [Xanthobacteraceae bacterium]
MKNEVIATSPVGQAPQALVYVPDAVPAVSGALNSAMTRMMVVPDGLGTNNLQRSTRRLQTFVQRPVSVTQIRIAWEALLLRNIRAGFCLVKLKRGPPVVRQFPSPLAALPFDPLKEPHPAQHIKQIRTAMPLLISPNGCASRSWKAAGRPQRCGALRVQTPRG